MLVIVVTLIVVCVVAVVAFNLYYQIRPLLREKPERKKAGD